jgi:hypothetical protein
MHARSKDLLVLKMLLTAPIPAFRAVEKPGRPWYNFNSRQVSLSISHFNNLKSICRHRADLGSGRFQG